MFKLILFVTLVIVQEALSQVNVGPCNNKWATQIRCTREGVARQARQDSQFPVPDQGSQNRIKRAVDTCFKQQGCYSSPVPTTQETNARRDCFRTAKRQLDQELNRCIDREVRGFNPPDDYDKIDIDEWGYTVQRVFDSLRNSRDYCGDNKRNGALKQCIEKNTNYNFNKRPPRTLPSYYCEEDARCWAATGAKCQQDWNDVVQPDLCTCSKKLGADRYTSQAVETYRQCIDRKVSTQVPNGDPGPTWLSDYVRNLCVNKNNHPCKRQRRDYENRG